MRNGNGNDLFLEVVPVAFQLESYWCREEERVWTNCTEYLTEVVLGIEIDPCYVR